MMTYQGIVIDRLESMETRKTKKYGSYYEAHTAAEKLCKRTMGERGSILVRELDDGTLTRTTSPELKADK